MKHEHAPSRQTSNISTVTPFAQRPDHSDPDPMSLKSSEVNWSSRSPLMLCSFGRPDRVFSAIQKKNHKEWRVEKLKSWKFCKNQVSHPGNTLRRIFLGMIYPLCPHIRYSHWVTIYQNYIPTTVSWPSYAQLCTAMPNLDPLLKEVLIVCEATGRHVLSHLMRAHARPRSSQTERT